MDYYLASIASEVRRSYVKDPRKVKLEDMLLKFNIKNDKAEVSSPARDEDQAEVQKVVSKSFWLGMFGIKER
jgi:hypothetical protein